MSSEHKCEHFQQLKFFGTNKPAHQDMKQRQWKLLLAPHPCKMQTHSRWARYTHKIVRLTEVTPFLHVI